MCSVVFFFLKPFVLKPVMWITVIPLLNKRPTACIHVKPTDNVGNVKERIKRLMRLSVDRQRLMFRGLAIEDDTTWIENGAQVRENVYLTFK